MEVPSNVSQVHSRNKSNSSLTCQGLVYAVRSLHAGCPTLKFVTVGQTRTVLLFINLQ